MNALIVYYTETGNTERVARILETVLKSRGYSTAVNKMSLAGVAKSFLGKGFQAIFGKPIKPEGTVLDVSGFDLVCLGSPMWAGNVPPPVKGWVQGCAGIKGKDVILFFSCGGTPSIRVLVKKMKKIFAAKEPASINAVYFSARDMKSPEYVMDSLKELIGEGSR